MQDEQNNPLNNQAPQDPAAASQPYTDVSSDDQGALNVDHNTVPVETTDSAAPETSVESVEPVEPAFGAPVEPAAAESVPAEESAVETPSAEDGPDATPQDPATGAL